MASLFANDDALCSGHPIWHAPGELTRESVNMSSGKSLLQGSHCGRNCSGDNGGIGRIALCNDDDNATGDALHLGHPVWHAPGELARDSGCMSLGTSLLRGSHLGTNHTGDDEGGCQRFALRDDDDGATGDALRLGHPIWHGPGELTRDSGIMPLGTSMLQGSHCGSNCTGDNGSICGHGGDWHQRSWTMQQLLSAPLRMSPPFISK